LVNLVVGLCAGPLACNTFGVAIKVTPPDWAHTWWKAPGESKPSEVAAGSAKDQPTNVTAKPALIQASNQVAAEQQGDNEPILIDPPPTLAEYLQQQSLQQPQPGRLDAKHLTQSKVPDELKRKPDPALVSALRCFLERRPVEAVESLKAYDKASQEFLLPMLPIAARVAEGGFNKVDAADATVFVSQLDQLREMLARRSNLLITQMRLCQRVRGFGVYEPWGDDHPFEPRQSMDIYVEVQNFSNQRGGNGYAIQLLSSAEVHDVHGGIAWSPTFREDAERSQTPRHDFFRYYWIPIPSNVQPGRYTLCLTITDVPTGRTATRSLGFQIAPSHVRAE
jgi:hypothetical protein